MAKVPAAKHHLLLLFDHPQEPIFMPKGPKGTVFDVPHSFLAPQYQPYFQTIYRRFTVLNRNIQEEEVKEQVEVKEIPINEREVEFVSRLKRDSNFSLFIPLHRKLAGKLVEMFLTSKNIEELLALAVYVRDRINPYLFNYAFAVALGHREDTNDLDVPSFLESFPDKFVEDDIFDEARAVTRVIPEGKRPVIDIAKDNTASDLEDEHRLAYFREDLGANLHHWHWHLVYPVDGPLDVVNKDRRGELFYYMHQQIIARYNFERFCNSLGRVERLSNWSSPIKEAYFPKLDSVVSSTNYAPRVANLTLRNLDRVSENLRRDVADLARWRDRIFSAIHKGFYKDKSNKEMPLTEENGIDVLGNMVEASDLSPNKGYYGDLHNMGHLFIAYIHDPDNRYLESHGVMGDLATAMRDPVFYRWHAFVDDMFQEYKATLPPYTLNQLNHPGVSVTDVTVQTGLAPPNTLHTFWQQSVVDLSNGMDFQSPGAVNVRFGHLQHQDFVYTITINNRTQIPKRGTVRIFLAPRCDERGNPWVLREQRTMFVELDKFRTTVSPGERTITRKSSQSTVTIPFERTFRHLSGLKEKKEEGLAKFKFCGCGWPHHLLIPKGTVEGMKCQLFVMFSNYEGDVVPGIGKFGEDCDDSESLCGIHKRKYPDKRAMGYPFDRIPRDGAETIKNFVKDCPNMILQDVVIKFHNKLFKKV